MYLKYAKFRAPPVRGQLFLHQRCPLIGKNNVFEIVDLDPNIQIMNILIGIDDLNPKLQICEIWSQI